MVTIFSMMAALLTSSAAGTVAGPVTVEIVASGHIETPADRFRVSGSALACAATQVEADALLANKVAAIDATMRSMGVTKAQAQERPSLGSMMGAMSSIRGAGGCNGVALSDLALGEEASKAQTPAAKTVGASASLSFDAPSRAVAVRAVAALKAADDKPSDKIIPILLDDTSARRAAKQQALVKARAEAVAYGLPLGLRAATLTKISEKQDWSSVDFVGQLFRTVGLASADPSETVATDVTLTVEFQLGN